MIDSLHVSNDETTKCFFQRSPVFGIIRHLCLVRHTQTTTERKRTSHPQQIQLQINFHVSSENVLTFYLPFCCCYWMLLKRQHKLKHVHNTRSERKFISEPENSNSDVNRKEDVEKSMFRFTNSYLVSLRKFHSKKHFASSAGHIKFKSF